MNEAGKLRKYICVVGELLFILIFGGHLKMLFLAAELLRLMVVGFSLCIDYFKFT